MNETGLPMKFRLRLNGHHVGYEMFNSGMREWCYYDKQMNWLGIEPIPHDSKDQAIGTEDSEGAELYFGDVVTWQMDNRKWVGEIVWFGFAVKVKIALTLAHTIYWNLPVLLDFKSFKKIGSFCDPKMEETLKKAELK